MSARVECPATADKSRQTLTGDTLWHLAMPAARPDLAPMAPATFAGAPVMSRPLMLGIILMIVAESAAVHALLYARWPIASLALLILNVATIWWIYREGTGRSCTSVGVDAIEVRHGRSTRLDIPLDSVRDARVPSWQDIPQAGTAGYLALSSGDDPNVVLALEPPARVRLTMGIRRSVSTLGLRLEAPHDFVAAVEGRLRVRNP